MIPLRDSTRSRTFPAVNVAIILINLAVWLYMLTLSPGEAMRFVFRYGFVPASLAAVDWSAPIAAATAVLPPLVTAMFVHGGWMHVVGNMLYLWVFGDNIEDRLGRARYVAFYLVCGILASLAHTLANPLSDRPAIGASGAVAGVLGAYLLSFPRARILALVPLGFFLHLTEIPAGFFLALWLILQLISGLGALVAVEQVGQLVAWWAHVGGFAAGVVLIVLLRGALRGRF
ncbi:MAG TPA: rhomboid family intramembrane serine protease [Clostridiales bacterium]|nr:rhomboid family intramembrane serine protease [Clostridiales bacterium]